jgi:hypothetical protein
MIYFQRAMGEDWHIAHETGAAALCGAEYDGTIGDVPPDGRLHLECREALAVEEQPKAEAEAALAAAALSADEVVAAVAEAEAIVTEPPANEAP